MLRKWMMGRVVPRATSSVSTLSGQALLQQSSLTCTNQNFFLYHEVLLTYPKRNPRNSVEKQQNVNENSKQHVLHLET